MQKTSGYRPGRRGRRSRVAGSVGGTQMWGARDVETHCYLLNCRRGRGSMKTEMRRG
jgi:hypothetical protein